MIVTVLKMVVFTIVLFTVGCSVQNYPENMSEEERKEYYQKFNESRTDEEWEALRAQRALEEKDNSTNKVAENSNRNKGSVSFSIKNNSLSSKRLRIADNILDFKPLGKRYLGFRPNTEVFLIQDGGKDKYLFTITEDDKGRAFKIVK